jgi:hypothetical protein
MRNSGNLGRIQADHYVDHSTGRIVFRRIHSPVINRDIRHLWWRDSSYGSGQFLHVVLIS